MIIIVNVYDNNQNHIAQQMVFTFWRVHMLNNDFKINLHVHVCLVNILNEGKSGFSYLIVWKL